MPRQPRITKQEIGNATFIGSMFSNEELAFLLEHFGGPPELALADEVELPPGVNEAAVRPILDVTYRLDLLEKAAQKQAGDDDLSIWAGFDKLRDICQKTLDWNATVAELKNRTRGSDPALRRAAGAPSLHMWDPDTDIPYLGGVGADADIVRTMLGENGERIPLYVALRSVGVGTIGSLAGVAKFLKSKSPEAQSKKLMDSIPNALAYEHGETTSVVKCPLCGHTEVFQTDKPSTKLKAERMMHSHLMTAKVKKEQHRMLSNRLKSGKAGTGSGAKKTLPPVPNVADETADEQENED